MEIKYGTVPTVQWNDHLYSLSKAVFLPLPFKEDGVENVDEYISSLILQLFGFNEMLGENKDVLTVIELLEGAKIELSREEFNYKLYRKAILDAYNLIKRIGG